MAIQSDYDLLLKGGHVIDPANHRDSRLDVALRGGKIAQVAADIDPRTAATVVDAVGLYVVPGLLDIHAHVYYTREPEGLGIMPDCHCFRSGVTTVVDTGTAARDHLRRGTWRGELLVSPGNALHRTRFRPGLH